MLQSAIRETPQTGQTVLDILELNHLRRSLLIGSHVWDHRLYSLDSHIKRSSNVKVKQINESCAEVKELRTESFHKDGSHDNGPGQIHPQSSNLQESLQSQMLGQLDELEPCDSETYTACHPEREEPHSDGELSANKMPSESHPSQESNLSERIDSAWTGTDQLPPNVKLHQTFQVEGQLAGCVKQTNQHDNPSFRRLTQPIRVHSFDSVLRIQERIRKGLPPALHLSTLRSFHASGDYRNMVRDPVSNILQAHFQLKNLYKMYLVMVCFCIVVLIILQIKT